MITIDDYFKKLKFIKTAALPPSIRNGYFFIQKITEGHTTWKYYKADKKIKQKVDEYFTSLNEFLNGSEKAPVTEAEAKDVAKELIRAYVMRGDSLESIASSHMGQYGSGSGAQIRKRKIEVEKVKGHRVNYSFSLPSIYVELKQERPRSFKPKPPVKHSKPTPQRIPEKSVARNLSPQESKPKSIKVDYSDSEPVEKIEDEIKFIKRFLSLHNKVKTKAQILNFINALQRAILEKRIRKTSKYAEEIMQMQKQLIASHKMMGAEQKFRLNDMALLKFTRIAGSSRVRFSIQYLKRFVGIQGKNITKEKAQSLHDAILRALESDKIVKTDPYMDRIKKVLNALKEFISVAKKNDVLEVHERALNGLNGVLGCLCEEEAKEKEVKGLDGIEPEKEVGEVMSVEEARNQEYQTVNITGKYLQLIGKFCLPTQFFVYGIGGSGKSSFVLLFTQYLASLGFKILYVAGEQFNTPTFKELLNRLNIYAEDNYKIVGKIDTLNPADFDFVVLDSKDKLEVDINQFTDYMKTYPKQSFIVLSQSTKNGSFTGKERWRNTVDVMIEAENGVIRTGHDKNRWGGAGEMHIFGNLEKNQVNGLEGTKKKKKNISRFPDWTEPKHLNEADWKDLKIIKKHYDNGDFKEAMNHAMYYSDTAVREEIPPNVWLEIGGSLTSTGKEKLKKLLEDYPEK